MSHVPVIVRPITRPAANAVPRVALNRAIGLALAALAAVHQMVIASRPTNDDFMHLTIADQLLAGDWPLRDFFDLYGPFMYGISAAGKLIFGHRLLSEAVVVGLALGVSTYLVFRLVRSLTGSTAAAALSALLLMVSGIRGYSYPKVFLYAVAATLWWGYVNRPTRLKALALGAWAAVAFYWRADHGVYIAVGAGLAMLSAHGVTRLALERLAQAAVVSILAVLPLLVLASMTVGLLSYVVDGVTIVHTQHATTSSHTWPKWPIRRVSDVIRLDGPEEFAPVVSLRWTDDSAPDARAAVIAKYGLTPVANDGPHVQAVRLSDGSPGVVRGLINEPIVADTDGIDRSQSTLPWSTYPLWQKLRFSHWWLRFRVFMGVSEHANAGEAVAAMFYVLPMVVLVAVPWMHRYLRPKATPLRLAGFGVFGIVTAFGLMRSPYEVRAVDDVVIPAILFGCCVAALWRTAMAARGVKRAVLGAAAIVLAVLMVKSVAVAGEFADRVAWLAGDGRSMPRMEGAWREVHDRLFADPPLSYWNGMRKPAELQLAQYAAECLPASQRLLVLWFAPEIYYHSGRLMASRHLYDPGYEELEQELRLTTDKIKRYAPPLVFATGELESYVAKVYPEVAQYVNRDYEAVGIIEDDGQRYRVFLRKDASIVRRFGEHEWPCLT
jgi:hypothetical protein